MPEEVTSKNEALLVTLGFMTRRICSATLLFGLLWILGGCHADPARKLVGSPFPAFALPSPGGRDSVRLSQLAGNPALVVFWATWCGPCGEEVGVLRQILSKYQSHGLKIVGLSIDETAAPVPLLVERLKIPYPVATGALPLFDHMGLESLPQSYLLDKNGLVVESFTGAVPARAFEQAIEALEKSK